MNYVLCEIYKRNGFKREVKFLSGMPPKFKINQWSFVLQDALIFREEDSFKLIESFKKKEQGEFKYKLKKRIKKVTHELNYLDSGTHEIVIGPGGVRVKAKPGCNSETGELF